MTTNPPLNVAYWATLSAGQQDDESLYDDALASYSKPIDRAIALWDWKDLSRGVPVERVTNALSNEELGLAITNPPDEAIASLANKLVERDALSNRTVVTPAFLLHLADSEPDHYSTKFPIIDVRCWVAYVYLTRRRSAEQSLPRSATSSPTKFGAFSNFFQQTLPDDVDGRTYERALFRFGAYIAALPGDTIGTIDGHLAQLEGAVIDALDQSGFALVAKREDEQTGP